MDLKKKILDMIKMEHHSDRVDIAGEMPFGDFGQLVAFIIFMTVWILDSFVFRFSTFLLQYDPFFFRIIFSIFLLGMAFYYTKSGLQIVFQEVRDPPELITKGVFQYSRHPIYLGALLAYLGLLIFTFSLISLGFLVIIWIFYDILASYEERMLLNLYGNAYEEYKDSVPKWFSILRLDRSKKKNE
jgi:protein-S-isoprenylcysteine O-methyltransferase Ste14